MFTINDDLSIYVTRGDMAYIKVTCNKNGKPYTFQVGDVVRFNVCEKKNCDKVVLQKDFPVTAVTQGVEIVLDGDDTKFGGIINKPTDYWYEVVLNPFDNPQTIICYDEDGTRVFRLYPEANDKPAPEPKPEVIRVIDTELDMTSERPVQNQAIARAFANLQAGYKATHDAVAKLNVTPEMFGAVGDGEADDTEAIQRAINAATSTKQKVLLLGKYYITAQLKANGDFHLVGDEVNRPTICTDKEIDSILFLGETTGGLVNISNINFECNGKCDGIKFGSSQFIYNKIDNVRFLYARACIRLYNDGQAKQKAFYSHNVEWTRIRNYGSASVISQTTVNGGGVPWVYGGVIHDVDYEGDHIAPTENEKYVMDLKGFRNLSISNLIFEGAANSIGNYDGVVYIDNCCDVNHVYFEIVNGANHFSNSFVVDTNEDVAIKNIYTTSIIPILIKQNCIVKTSFLYVLANQLEMLDSASVGTLDIEYLKFGSWHSGNLDSDVISSKNKYHRLLHGTRLILVDDVKPFFSIDFDKMSEDRNYLSDVLTIAGDHGAGVPEMEFVNDPLYGTCLKVYNTNYNLAHCYFAINLGDANVGDVLIAVTYKSNSNAPHRKRHSIAGASLVSFDSGTLTEPNKYHTVLGTYNGSILTFRPDYIGDIGEDNQYSKQSYTIADISVFKGFHYGSCKSKLNTTNY